MQQSDSRRSVQVYLTDKGRQKTKQLPNIVSQVNANFLKALTGEEKATLIHLLQKVATIPVEGDPDL